jgi:flagellar hook-basal body complex protein FliE
MIAALSSALHALGPQAVIGPLSSPAAGEATAPAGAGSFGSALSNMIGSLDQTQQTAASDAQGLATGTITDPTQAVTSVENASLSMDLAAQVRDKLVAAEQQIFTTQV